MLKVSVLGLERTPLGTVPVSRQGSGRSIAEKTQQHAAIQWDHNKVIVKEITSRGTSIALDKAATVPATKLQDVVVVVEPPANTTPYLQHQMESLQQQFAQLEQRLQQKQEKWEQKQEQWEQEKQEMWQQKQEMWQQKQQKVEEKVEQQGQRLSGLERMNLLGLRAVADRARRKLLRGQRLKEEDKVQVWNGWVDSSTDEQRQGLSMEAARLTKYYKGSIMDMGADAAHEFSSQELEEAVSAATGAMPYIRELFDFVQKRN